MKKILILAGIALALTAEAQTKADPIIMTVNGTPVTRSEFEYSYNKNGSQEDAVEQKSVEEYVPMFVNYKLKVEAAKEARMDTAAAFKKEFLQYRDMQLTPYMVDSLYIDSVARSIYDSSEKQLGGKDLLQPRHILIGVKQNATDAENAAGKALADSLYEELVNGADFAELAKQYSKDPGTAARGGLLPWIGPGNTLPEFEEAAYALNVGEMSHPVKTAAGYHIIRMEDRKALEPYDTLRPQIVRFLKSRGIEEASAEAKIKKIVDASGGRLNRESVLDSVLAAHVGTDNDLKYLVQEYHDGLLFYDVSKQQVWDPAKADTQALETQFKKNKKKYAWTEPRFKGFVIHGKTAADVKAAKKVLKANADGDWRAAIKSQVNKDSTVVSVSGPMLVKSGENAYVDGLVFGKDKKAQNKKYPVSDVFGKKLSQPKSYLDVKSVVENDLQDIREKEWVEGLRKKYPVTINEDVVKTVNQHD